MTLTSVNTNVSSDYTVTGSTTVADGKVYSTGNATYGAYYNWNTAVAGGKGDICPKNWRLPTGGTSGEWKALCDIYFL